jgi:hypothetical protein
VYAPPPRAPFAGDGYEDDDEEDGQSEGYDAASQSQLLSGEASQSEVQPQLLMQQDLPAMLQIIK